MLTAEETRTDEGATTAWVDPDGASTHKLLQTFESLRQEISRERFGNTGLSPGFDSLSVACPPVTGSPVDALITCTATVRKALHDRLLLEFVARMTQDPQSGPGVVVAQGHGWSLLRARRSTQYITTKAV